MNITVYCSSRADLPSEYRRMAVATGSWIGSHGHRLVFGGCNAGLMHDVAQACHDAGGLITGVITEGFRHRLDPLVNTEIVTPDLNHRKAHMIAISNLFVVLPGGLGTIDEWLSTLSQLVVDNDNSRPIIVANPDGLYDNVFAQLQRFADTRLADKAVVARSYCCPDTPSLINALNNASVNL